VLKFTDAEIQAKAEQLGLAFEGGDGFPHRHRSTIVAALVEDHRVESAAAAQPSDDGLHVGGQITIRPGASIELDGHRLPAASAPVEITVSSDPDVPSTVRLTLLANTVQTIKE
jgi:hypothetical protein